MIVGEGALMTEVGTPTLSDKPRDGKPVADGSGKEMTVGKINSLLIPAPSWRLMMRCKLGRANAEPVRARVRRVLASMMDVQSEGVLGDFRIE